MANPITDADVRHVAQLSRLKLSDEQIAEYTQQLGRVLGYIDKLSELDVEGVKPMAHALDMSNVLREDVPVEGMPVDKALATAPAADPPFFKVPKVLGEGSGA